MDFALIRFPDEDKIYITDSVFDTTDNKTGVCGVHDTISGYVIIAPFNPEANPLRLPCRHWITEADGVAKYDDILNRWIVENECMAWGVTAEERDSTREEHLDIVNKCVELLHTLAGDNKIVVARTETKPLDTIGYTSLPALYRELLKRRHDACVFLFSTAKSGTWLGASPELLVDQDGVNIRSVSLAGTRRVTEAESETAWDEKNVVEQKIVTDEILKVYRSFGLSPVSVGPTTRRAGNVEHLCTEIKALTDKRIVSRYAVANSAVADNGDNIGMSIELKGDAPTNDRCCTIGLEIAAALSPTPALCGYPRETALDFITNNEIVAREYYGGYIGVSFTGKTEKTQLYVNLRSLRYLPKHNQIRMYAGGGITAKSTAENELIETDNKFKWIN